MAKKIVQAPGFVVADIAALKNLIQKYEDLALQIEAAVPHNLTSETDEKAIHATLIKVPEALGRISVQIRNGFGDLTKKFIGVDGSIADQAVQRRKELFIKKADTKEAEKKKPAEAELVK